MNVFDLIAFWGSIASIVGLAVALIQIHANRKRIKAIERMVTVEVDSPSDAKASASALASGGIQEAAQTVTQVVSASGGPGLHRVRCPIVREEVDASVNALGQTFQVVCKHLQRDYHCDASPNRENDCIAVDRGLISRMRNPPKRVRLSEMQQHPSSIRRQY
jgi:hypothetical protein